LAIWRIFRRSPLSEEKYPNRNPAWKQSLLIIDFQGNTRKGSSTSLSDAGKARLNGDTKREADSGEVAEMRKQNGELKEALAEEILRNRFLKKLSKGME